MNLLGRGFDVNVTIVGPFVSRVHCEINFNRNEGMFRVQDVNSLNGTYINNYLIPRRQSYPFNFGDRIGFGISWDDFCDNESFQNNERYYVYRLTRLTLTNNPDSHVADINEITSQCQQLNIANV